MWELDYKESWTPKNWCFWAVVLEKTLESPLDCKEIQPVHPKGDQSWVFIGRTDVEAETPIFWPPDAKSWLIWKHPDAGKDWKWEEKRTTEDEMIRWYHWLDACEFEWTLGNGDGQGGLASCNSWGHKESDMTEQLNWTDLSTYLVKNLKQHPARVFYYILDLPFLLDFPGGSDGKASVYDAGDPGSIPGLGRSPGEGNGNPLTLTYLTSYTGKDLKKSGHMYMHNWITLLWWNQHNIEYQLYST